MIVILHDLLSVRRLSVCKTIYCGILVRVFDKNGISHKTSEKQYAKLGEASNFPERCQDSVF